MKKVLKKLKLRVEVEERMLALFVAAIALVAPFAGHASEFIGMGAAYAHRLLRDRAISRLWLGPQALNSSVPPSALAGGDAQPLSEAQETPTPPLITQHSSLNTIPNWSARGAYEDWVHIDLPEAFRFPVGLEYVDRITVMAWGEVRGIAALPRRVSIAPTAYSLHTTLSSSVSHGLTPSNSYLIAWQNACVERSATNRVNAAIELFPNGSVVTTWQPNAPNQPPTTINQQPTPPPGFHGHGQDADWIRANFELLQSFDSSLTNADEIISLGYDNWLMDCAVGINVENGHYRCSVTVLDLPEDGKPCYLVCGPHKVNVTQIGTYRFPLEVLETYEVRTYPDALPIILDYDDGYRGEGVSFEIFDDAEEGTYAAPRRARAASVQDPGQTNVHHAGMNPLLATSRTVMSLDEANEVVVVVYCNLENPNKSFLSDVQRLYYSWVAPNSAQFHNIVQADVITARAQVAGLIREGYIQIVDTNPAPEPERYEAHVFSGELLHAEAGTNGVTNVHFTVTTPLGSMAVTTNSTTVTIPTNCNCRIDVYLGTMEDLYMEQFFYDDRVSWRVTANGSVISSGQTSTHERRTEIAKAEDQPHDQYGFDECPILLDSRVVEASSGLPLQIDITCTAQHATDTLRETCVQVVVSMLPIVY